MARGIRRRGQAGWTAWRAVAALVLLLAFGLLAPAQGEPAATTRAQANAAIADLDLQRDLPREPGPERAHPWVIVLPPELFWLVIIVGATLLALHLGGQMPLPLWLLRRRGWEDDRASEAAAASGMPAPAVVLGEADDLARQGRFVEAMHVLLLRGLAELRRRLDEEYAPSLTSREILRRTRVSERGRAALRDIVARVEWAYFGEHDATEADYAACRRRYDELSEALVRGDAA